MNIVMDRAEEISTKTGARKSVGKDISHLVMLISLSHTSLIKSFLLLYSVFKLGRILLKGDCITLMQRANPGAMDEEGAED